MHTSCPTPSKVTGAKLASCWSSAPCERVGATALCATLKAAKHLVVACATRLEISSSNCSDSWSTAFNPVWNESADIEAVTRTTTPIIGTSSDECGDLNMRDRFCFIPEGYTLHQRAALTAFFARCHSVNRNPSTKRLYQNLGTKFMSSASNAAACTAWWRSRQFKVILIGNHARSPRHSGRGLVQTRTTFVA